MAEIDFPQKRRELQHRLVDSTIWNEVAFRDDDIVVATYGKSGTTWIQQIVAQLIFDGAEDLDMPKLSFWLDARLTPRAEKLAQIAAQRHRRFIKTHLPVDALVYSPKAKYIYIGRDGRDVVWSLYNHLVSTTDEFISAANTGADDNSPPFDRPSGSVRDFYFQWLERSGQPLWPFWENIRSWWAVRQVPNLLLVHFADLKADLEGQIRRIADFLEIEIAEPRWPVIVEHCGFDYMKANAEKCAPANGASWKGGAKTFIHKGINARWRDVLTPEDCSFYEKLARRELGEECANWLERGSLAAL
ncbi:MAG TPA: sulfotransferase domain-containing protein [Aliidongia sp.]|nr:sulfotransferase domain-containing protein [Aliidongia sp.]